MVSVLALDLGASSGRAVLGSFDGEHLTTRDTHRFANEPVRVHKRIYWDILRLFHEVKNALHATRMQGQEELESLGIDAWGVDFGLLGRHGELLANPYHYRDSYTDGMMEEVWKVVPREELFARTGIQFIQLNTIYQLYALKRANSPLLKEASTLLMIPELLRYFLTGERLSEWTVSSTTQLCNPSARDWDRDLIERLGLPSGLFLPPVAPGSLAGDLLSVVKDEVGYSKLTTIAVAEHDTGSAVVAVPALDADFAYLSSGTWSLLGTEIAQPLLNQQALGGNLTNEGGYGGSVRLLKNVTGLWLIQECRRIWRNEGKHINYAEELALIEEATPFQCWIDPDHHMFLSPQHMPRQIQQYCRETGQHVPQSEGEILRCIAESLALRYRFVLERIEEVAQKRFKGIHVVGGGVQNTALCQCTANALARPVWAGPQEATAIGNLLVQYLSLGQMRDLAHARSVVRNSFPIVTYEPADTEQWEQAYQSFCQIVGSS